MKKLILALVALFTMTVTASAMSYEQAREQALFLTDKMAYELNLTDDQYEAAYEVNLDYLMGVNDYNDLYGAYWTQRNLDLSYILLDWQYRTFVNAAYFYRPLYWDGGYWHFGIYARYPHRSYFFYGRPHFYTVYRGGHSWRYNNGRSWYRGRTYGYHHGGERRIGMRDGFNRGDYGRGRSYDQNANYQSNRSNRSFGNMDRSSSRVYQSSTRTTVNRDRNYGDRRVDSGNSQSSRSRIFGGNTSGSSERGNSSFGTRSNSNSSSNNVGSNSSRSGSFGGHGNSSFNRGNSGSTRSSTRSASPSPSRPSSTRSGSFGGHR